MQKVDLVTYEGLNLIIFSQLQCERSRTDRSHQQCPLVFASLLSHGVMIILLL